MEPAGSWAMSSASAWRLSVSRSPRRSRRSPAALTALLLALLPIYAIGYTTSAFLLGRAIVRPPTSRFLAFLAGWGILRAIALVPGLGILAWFGATVFGLGALVVALWRSRRGPVVGGAPLTA